MTPRYPKPRILADLPPRGHVVIEASAGTGKTYTLEHLIIELLLSTDVKRHEGAAIPQRSSSSAEPAAKSQFGAA